MKLPDPRKYDPNPRYFTALRHKLGWTQEECAERLCVTPRTILRYESGATHYPYAMQYLLESYAS